LNGSKVSRRDLLLINQTLVVIEIFHELQGILHHVLGHLPRIFLLDTDLASSDGDAVVNGSDSNVKLKHGKEADSDITRGVVKRLECIEVLLLKTLKGSLGLLDERLSSI